MRACILLNLLFFTLVFYDKSAWLLIWSWYIWLTCHRNKWFYAYVKHFFINPLTPTMMASSCDYRIIITVFLLSSSYHYPLPPLLHTFLISPPLAIYTQSTESQDWISSRRDLMLSAFSICLMPWFSHCLSTSHPSLYVYQHHHRPTQHGEG